MQQDHTRHSLIVSYGRAEVTIDPLYTVPRVILQADRNEYHTSPVERDANIAHAVACWNAIEDIGGDPATVKNLLDDCRDMLDQQERDYESDPEGIPESGKRVQAILATLS